MIESISIKNFQSHKETKVDFVDGVNVLTGASDQGKSAVLRALLWVINNRPLGTDDIVSHWIRDTKNKIDGEMSVTVCTDSGAVKRKRTAEANEYILLTGDTGEKQKTFAAVNKDVPEDIVKFFRLSDVSIQSQHDAPFLLSASPSDVAKYLNRIVRLDVIDLVLSNAESARRETNKKIKETESEIKSLEKQIENYAWIETAQVLAEKLTNTEARINEYTKDSGTVSQDISQYTENREFLKDFPDVKKANALIEKIENIVIDYDAVSALEKDIEKYREVNRDRKLFNMVTPGKDLLAGIEKCESVKETLKADIEHLQGEIKEYAESKRLSDLGFDKTRAAELIAEIESIRPDYTLLRELHYQVDEYAKVYNGIMEAQKELEVLKAQLPDVCPECGQSLQGVK